MEEAGVGVEQAVRAATAVTPTISDKRRLDIFMAQVKSLKIHKIRSGPHGFKTRSIP